LLEVTCNEFGISQSVGYLLEIVIGTKHGISSGSLASKCAIHDGGSDGLRAAAAHALPSRR
jgi:hypothetical protein